MPWLRQLVASLSPQGPGIQSQASAHVICDGQSGTGTGFSQGMLVFLCQYHSISAPCSFIQLPLMLYNHSNDSVMKYTHTHTHTHTQCVIQLLPRHALAIHLVTMPTTPLVKFMAVSGTRHTTLHQKHQEIS